MYRRRGTNVDKQWTFEIVGRKVGAIGICYPITLTVEAPTYDEAVLRMNDTHEHISVKSYTVREPSP